MLSLLNRLLCPSRLTWAVKRKKSKVAGCRSTAGPSWGLMALSGVVSILMNDLIGSCAEMTMQAENFVFRQLYSS